jgi:uncharacterized membrane protein
MQLGLIFDIPEPEGWLPTLETGLRFGTQLLSRTAEVSAAVIIAVGVLTALGSYVGAQRRRPNRRADRLAQIERIRLQLGRTLGLGLEFLLAADILATAVAPSWDAIGKLAAIATIRTLLNYFLGREVRQEEARQIWSEPRAQPSDRTVARSHRAQEPIP